MIFCVWNLEASVTRGLWGGVQRDRSQGQRARMGAGGAEPRACCVCVEVGEGTACLQALGCWAGEENLMREREGEGRLARALDSGRTWVPLCGLEARLCVWMILKQKPGPEKPAGTKNHNHGDLGGRAHWVGGQEGGPALHSQACPSSGCTHCRKAGRVQTGTARGWPL